MLRRIANALTLLSAVVCVGSAMLVGRSFWRADQVWTTGRVQASIGTVDGLVILSVVYNREADGVEVGGFRTHDSAQLRTPSAAMLRRMKGVRWLGVGFTHSPGWPVTITELILPLWLLPLLTAIAPVRWWRVRRREGGRGFAVEGAG